MDSDEAGGPPDPAVGEEFREVASPIVSRKEGPTEQLELIELMSRFDYGSDTDDMDRILTRPEGVSTQQ